MAKNARVLNVRAPNFENLKVDPNFTWVISYPRIGGGAFSFFQEKNHIHHPDNLYLSCSKCNISLNASFPDDHLRKNIIDPSFGTIGDYIRSDPEYFSRSEE